MVSSTLQHEDFHLPITQAADTHCAVRTTYGARTRRLHTTATLNEEYEDRIPLLPPGEAACTRRAVRTTYLIRTRRLQTTVTLDQSISGPQSPSSARRSRMYSWCRSDCIPIRIYERPDDCGLRRLRKKVASSAEKYIRERYSGYILHTYSSSASTICTTIPLAAPPPLQIAAHPYSPFFN